MTIRLAVPGDAQRIEEAASQAGRGVLPYHELAAIYVDPTAARCGMGTALLRAAVDGRPEPTLLWVLEGNTGARRFYERHGFAWDGTRKLLHDLPNDVPELRYRRSPT